MNACLIILVFFFLILFPALRLWIFVKGWGLLNTYVESSIQDIRYSADIWYHLCSRCCAQCYEGYEDVTEVLTVEVESWQGQWRQEHVFPSLSMLLIL